MWLEYLHENRTEVLLALGVLFSTYFLLIILKRWRRNFPPGPIGLPIVGYLPFVTKNVVKKLTELSKKYGEVFSLRMGSELVVVLNGTQSIREAFAKTEFLGRPPVSAFTLFSDTDNESPFFVSGMHVWQEQRKFVVQTMKDLGLGKSKIEGHIQDEINYFIQVLMESKSEPIVLKPILTPSMSNNISSLVFGKRYDYTDPERIKLDNSLEEVSKIAGQTSIHIFFPWIKYVPFVLRFFNLEEGIKSAKCMEDIYRRQIREHRDTLDPKHSRDFIDNYLVEMEVRQKKDPNTTFTDKTLIGSVSDIFGAGSETVRTSISWCMYIMAGYPDVQRKVHKEILDVLGPERIPEFSDQRNMPFTHSVILEITRWKTILPLNILRYTIADTSVSGYHVPKNTIVLANFWAPHHDPRNFEDPDTFKPERFLSPDGKSVTKPSHLMPFSVGKRVCPGETMANMEIFLYFVSILQKFEVAFPEGYQPDFQGEEAITYRPKTYKIRFIPRS